MKYNIFTVGFYKDSLSLFVYDEDHLFKMIECKIFVSVLE